MSKYRLIKPSIHRHDYVLQESVPIYGEDNYKEQISQWINVVEIRLLDGLKSHVDDVVRILRREYEQT